MMLNQIGSGDEYNKNNIKNGYLIALYLLKSLSGHIGTKHYLQAIHSYMMQLCREYNKTPTPSSNLMTISLFYMLVLGIFSCRRRVRIITTNNLNLLFTALKWASTSLSPVIN